VRVIRIVMRIKVERKRENIEGEGIRKGRRKARRRLLIIRIMVYVIVVRIGVK